MTNPNLRIERTRNRHSRAVMDNDVIVIRLAKNLSAVEERRHIESLSKRMQKMIAREQMRVRIDPFQPLFHGHSELSFTLTTGQHCRIFLSPGTKTRARWRGDAWHVDVGPSTYRRELHRFLWKLLSIAATKDAELLVEKINGITLNVPIGRVHLRAMTTQWGSCSSRGNITLNTALFLLPRHLLSYVIIHELAHRTVRNHSKKFWDLVESVCPNAKEAQKELREYRIHGL